MNFGRGVVFRGRGFRGGGFGFRNRFFATGVPGWARFGSFAAPFQKIDPEAEKQALNAQAENLQSEMDEIKKRLDELTANGRGK